MDNIAICQVKDLEPAARAWVGRLLGRDMADDERLTVLALPPHQAPSNAARNAAIARMDGALAQLDERTKGIPEAEIEEAIDEAMEHVRRWKD